MPEDAFYYLNIARNLQRIGVSSFDGGATLTTGYHPLWAWLLAVVSWGFPEREIYLRAAVGCSALLGLLAAALWSKKVFQGRPEQLVALAVGMTSYSFLNNLYSAMEWSLVLLLEAAYFGIALGEDKATGRATWRRAVGAFLIGLALCLARSDAGLVAFCCLMAAVAVWRLRGVTTYLVPTLSGLCGSVIGTGLVMAYCKAVSGHWLQGSVRGKMRWAEAAGFDLAPFIRLSIRTLVYYVRPQLNLMQGPAMKVLLLPVLAAIALILFWRRKQWNAQEISSEVRALEPRELTLLLAALAIMLGYALVDGRAAAGLQLWYSAHLTWPLVILLALVLRFAGRRGRRLWIACGAGVVGLGVVLFTVAGGAIYPEQQPALQWAQILRSQLAGERVGISDSGIVGFFQGGTVINLDGLANDEIQDYAPDRLHCYLGRKKISYFSGFGVLNERLSPPPVAYDGYSEAIAFGDGASPLWLRRVRPVSLAKLGCGEGAVSGP